MNVKIGILCCGLAGVASGVQTLDTKYRTNGPLMHQAVEPVREYLQMSSAVVVKLDLEKKKRTEVSYATVVSEDGYLLTKASEVGKAEGMSVFLDKKVYREVRWVAEDPQWDVALLKVEATGLKPVVTEGVEEPVRGMWLVANGSMTMVKRGPQVGIVAANPREIPWEGGLLLGLSWGEEGDDLEVKGVLEKSGAEEAGVREGDVVTVVDGKEVKSRKDLGDLLDGHRVGDRVRLKVKRGKKEVELEVVLKSGIELVGRQLSRNDGMSGEFSDRRSGFPRVIQHDVMGSRWTMGGPLFGLDGTFYGMNIARVNRCETFAIPAKEVGEIAARMIAADRGE